MAKRTLQEGNCILANANPDVEKAGQADITPAMVEAGVKALSGIREEDWPFENLGLLAIEVFEAMLEVRHQSPP